MTSMLLFIAVILLTCSLLKKISGKLGIPALLSFIILGMLFGSDGIFKIPFEDYEFAQMISTIALIFIMFTGGFETNLKSAKSVLTNAIVLSSLGTILTALFVGLFCHYVLNMSLLEGLLCGAVLGSTDAASVFSILRSKKLALKDDTAPLLEVESGSNDPFAYMLTVVILMAMETGVNTSIVITILLKQVLIGVVGGFSIGYIAKKMGQHNFKESSGISMLFVVGVALLGYAAPDVLGGNGFLSVYIIGIILGNAKLEHQKVLVSFFDGLTENMQAILFFLLGLLSFPSRMIDVIGIAILIALFLTLAARPLVVFLLAYKSSTPRKLLISFSGLRGAASIVFAIQAVLSPASLGYDIFHIVFIVVLLSISIQGTLLPLVAKKLDMIDYEGDVLKTFTDYVDEKPVFYIKFKISEGHKWFKQKIKDLVLPPNSLFVSILRDGNHITPNGEEILLENDIVYMCTLDEPETSDFYLKEKTITKDDLKHGNSLEVVAKDLDALVILVQRGEEYFVPTGSTILEINDHLLLNYKD